MKWAIETRDMKKHFGEIRAVNGLELKVKRGETYGILGPNGSGKTTTIKLLCGLIRKDSGSARVLGCDIPDKKVMNRVGYMPQETAVYLDNTVHENLQMFADIYGMSRELFARREEEMLHFVDLSDRKNCLVTTLSGGMKHRVSLACSLIHDPELLFLDEPTVGVDPELRATFWHYFEELSKRGVTVVITTHYMDEASHCTRVGMIRLGQLIAEGSPAELLRATGCTSLEDAFLKLARRDDK